MSTIEDRLRSIEDRLAIQDLLARYGPAVDTGHGPELARMWWPDGWYRFDGNQISGEAIADLVELESHQRYLRAGCAHLLTTPHIEIAGDNASAINHSCVLVADHGSWRAERVSANRWTFIRTAGGWRINTRENKLIDGPAAALDIFAGNG